MREIAIWCELDIRDDIGSENLATEHRWERLVLDALLKCPEIEKVYSVLPIWKSPRPMPTKFVNGTTAEKLRELVVVAPNAWPLHLRPRGMVVGTYYDSLRTYPEFKELEDYCSGRILLIDPFEDFSVTHGLSTLPGHSKYFESIFLPRIPDVKLDSQPENKNILLWPHKGALDHMRYGLADMKPIYNWVASRLEIDPSLRFHFLTGALASSLEFLHYPQLQDFFWTHETTMSLKRFQDRCTLHHAESWDEVQKLYSQTKLMISSLRGGAFFAGSAQEAAMYGIPFIQTVPEPNWNTSDPNLSAEWNSPEFYSIMNRLLTDNAFYLASSAALKTFAKRYTYQTFTTNLLAALARRGI